MIRVKKPAKGPATLKKKGDAAQKRLCEAYAASPDDYRDGEKTFVHESDIYNAKSVKNALLKAQHSKCCYCEWKLSPGSFGDVEHFRPKAGYKQSKAESLGRPGYYWLAYDWSNLYLACQVCNQSHKQNYFPLADPTLRAVCHEDDLLREQPLLIDPGKMDPSQHIGFREEYPYAIGGNPIGTTTIDFLGLATRPDLIEARRTLLTNLKLLLVNRDVLAARIESGDQSAASRALLSKLDKYLDNRKSDSAEFAAMVRAALNS